MSHIWIVDDEASICLTLKSACAHQGYLARTFSNAEDAISELERLSASSPQQGVPDLIILDVRLPGIDGIQALPKIRGLVASIPIVVITAFGDLPTAVQAIKGNVFEYLTKPFDLDKVLTTIERGLRNRDVASSRTARPTLLPKVPSDGINELELIGSSPRMQKVFKDIALAAMSDCPILIQGESGTGKELVARAIHHNSNRKSQPYLAVAPVSLNPSLIESELFGHVRGSFTGADQNRVGVFELAGKGTLLLDEIGDVPIGQQVKLLRVLEQREFIPVGSSMPKLVQSRIIAATHRNLAQMVAENAFREDLYFRLSVFVIEMPPLRERRCDIVPLACKFLRCQGLEANHECLAAETKAILEAYEWPGNVRELKNAIEHAAILARGNRIYPEHLPRFRRPSPEQLHQCTTSLDSQLEELIRNWVAKKSAEAVPDRSNFGGEEAVSGDSEMQRQPGLYEEFLNVVEPPLLKALLDCNQHNRAAVAQRLGMHRSTLRQKMRNYALEP